LSKTVKATFTIGGALRAPCAPPTPVECGVGSENAWDGRWHVAHDTVPSRERRPSKKSQRPSRTFSGVTFTFAAAKFTSIPSGGVGRGRTGLSRSQAASEARRASAEAGARGGARTVVARHAMAQSAIAASVKGRTVLIVRRTAARRGTRQGVAPAVRSPDPSPAS
jgi:hypothetical protein